jgi:hypothetical protein
VNSIISINQTHGLIHGKRGVNKDKRGSFYR